jgi:cyclopropane fatty-acyl-phospholipid synthase-like methyltransferase
MMIKEVPSPIDLRQMDDAREWESTAMIKRPWRTEFFDCFVSLIQLSATAESRLLELGSGPGFLAEHILKRVPQIFYVALDFSAAMHDLAIERLGSHASDVRFITRSFREDDWPQGLGQFDYVVTNQAVHELRHKAYAQTLHQQVRSILSPGGSYLVCDHFAGEDGMQNSELFTTVSEQRTALLNAGFSRVEQLMRKGSLVLHLATG